MREKKENDMNKKTKLLLVLLSSTALTAGAFGLAACSGEAHNEEYYAQYQQYVSATAEGEVLSYEDWLIGILEDAKGEKGEKGDTGEAGKAGTQWTVGDGDPAATTGADGDFYLNKTTFDVYNKANGTWTKIGSIKGSDGAAGATGNGIDTIVYKGGALEVSLTSGDKITVALPDEITHVHTYGETLTTLIEPTGESEGLAYKECTDADCEHIELVTIPKLQYEITVMYNNAPLAEADITVAGEGISESGTVTAKTDAEGKVTIAPDKVGEYTISVAGYTVIEGGKTSTTENSFTIEVAKNLQSDSTIGAGKYAVSVGGTTNDMSFSVSAEDEAIKYTFSMEGYGLINYMKYNSNWESYEPVAVSYNEDNEYECVIEAGQSSLYQVATDWETLYNENPDYDMAPKPLVAVLTIEEDVAPALGDKIRPVAIELGDLAEGTVGEDGWAYFNMAVNDSSEEITHVKFTFDSSVTVEFNQYNGVLWKPMAGYTSVTSEEAFSLTNDGSSIGSQTYTFRAKTTEEGGQVSIQTDVMVMPGTASNPEEIESGNITSDLTMGKQYYYKWNAEANGDYVFAAAKGNITIFSDPTCDYTSYIGTASEGNILGLKTTEATTYYLVADGSSFGLDFTIRNYNADTDAGLVETHPIDISDWTTSEGKQAYTYSNADIANATTLYFTMTAPTSGRFVVISNSDTTTYYCMESGSIYEEGAELSITVNSYDANAGYDFNIEWHELATEVDYTIVLKDTEGNIVEGAVITAIGGEGEPVVTAATDAEGKTTIKLNPANSYTFEAEFAEGSHYGEFVWAFDTASGLYDFGGEIAIDTVVKLYAHTVTILSTDGTTPIEGATVSLKEGTTGSIANSAVTNAEGKAVIYVAKITEDSYFSAYYVEVEYPEGYEGYTAGSASLAMGVYELTVTSKTINIVGEDLKLLEGINAVTIEDPYGEIEFTFTAGAAGSYTIAASNVSASFFWTWCVDGKYYPANSTSVTVEATEGQEITVSFSGASAANITITKN